MSIIVNDKERFERLKKKSYKMGYKEDLTLDSTYFMDAYLNNLDRPPMFREAIAIKNKLDNIDIQINDEEFIIGKLHSELFDFYYGAGIVLYDDMQTLKKLNNSDVELKNKLKIAREYVTGIHIRSNMKEIESQAMSGGLVATQCWGGHMVADYERVLNIGLVGIEEGITAKEKFTTVKNQCFVDSLKCTIKALSNYILRHSQKTITLSEETTDVRRKEELYRIADVCKHISELPPRTFHEALQLTWFIHMFTGCDSLGRFDQYLFKFYNQDIKKGILTREEAACMLKYFWLKIIEAGFIQNLTLGGLNYKGLDASNDLTHLCIETTRNLKVPQPNLSLRISLSTPSSLLQLAFNTIKLGMGVPALYNDEIITLGLKDIGIPSYDRWNYSLSGCSQVVIPGKSHFGCDDGIFNTAKCVELALNNGIDPLTGKQIGLETGKLENFVDFNSVMEAYKKQVEHGAKLLSGIVNNTDKIYSQWCGDPIRTLFTQGCLDTEKGIWDGGAVYNCIQAECIGITNAANSLFAIKKLVFEENRCSLPNLSNILKNNWKGHEELALYAKNKISKFGNDDDSVDEIYSEVANTVYSTVRCQTSRRGVMVLPGSVIFVYHTHYGNNTGATPDGRRSGEPLADSAGPSQGTGKEGPTSICNSLSKIDQSQATTCMTLNIMFSRKDFQGDKLEALLKTYFQQGGMQMQINVVDKNILIEAQERPEDFQGLTIRVGGFSAYFTTLDKGLQDEIISRIAY